MTDRNTPDMTLLDAEILRVQRTLAHLSKMLLMMEAEMMEGDPASIKEAGKLLAEIRNWSRVAMETEARFEERKKQRAGIVNAYALDLDEARTQIGCRLARLRRCCTSGAVSE